MKLVRNWLHILYGLRKKNISLFDILKIWSFPQPWSSSSTTLALMVSFDSSQFLHLASFDWAQVSEDKVGAGLARPISSLRYYSSDYLALFWSL